VTSSGDETILHTFAGSDGADPLAALVQDTKGNLYGTTTEGGAHSWFLEGWKVLTAVMFTSLHT
jgi:hypothetical protein